MKAYSLPAIFLLFYSASAGQGVIEWRPGFSLELSDFQSPTTRIGETDFYSLHPACGVEFSFMMSNFEFMATKNFNSKISNNFKRGASSLIARDETSAQQLVDLAQYYFDLCELYARKFRKLIFEEKSTFSNASFFQPLFDLSQKELAERYDFATNETKFGQDSAKLTELHNEVLMEIEELSEFCKECKPVKKKKQKRE